MTTTARPDIPTRTPVWLSDAECHLADFVALVGATTRASDYPLVDSVQQNVPVYDCDRLRERVATPTGRREAQAELVRALTDGPGIVVFKRAFRDLAVVDGASGASKR